MEEANPVPFSSYNLMGYYSTGILVTGADVLSVVVYVFLSFIVVDILRMLFEDSMYLRRLLYRYVDNALYSLIFVTFMKFSFTSHLNMAHLTTLDG
jgi:hypothetical protein